MRLGVLKKIMDPRVVSARGRLSAALLLTKNKDRVRGIDQTADFLRIFEVGAKIGPVFPPRLCDVSAYNKK